MINLVKNFFNFCREQNRRKIAIKRYLINQQLVKFYEDLQKTKEEYNNIPACLLAHQAMREVVKSDKDVNHFYKKLTSAGLV